MPTATATRPPHPDTHASSPAPGITTAEADLITNAARHFLTATVTASPDTSMAAIAAQIDTLFDPYTPAAVHNYACAKSAQSTHYCTIS